jgi:hypothetical protein
MNDMMKSMVCIKIVSIIPILAALLLIGLGSGQDWLEEGFVRSGDYGDMRQYFMDPIFFSPGSSYVSSGPFMSPTGGKKMSFFLDRRPNGQDGLNKQKLRIMQEQDFPSRRIPNPAIRLLPYNLL